MSKNIIPTRIQSRLNRKGIKVSLGEIKNALSQTVNDADNISSDEIETVVQYFIDQSSKPVVSQESDEGYQDQSKELNKIVVSAQQKQELISRTAQQVGVELVGSEVSEIAQGIASGFDSREQMFSEITAAIVAFVDYRINMQSEFIQDAAQQIRSKLNSGNESMRESFDSIRQGVESTNDDFKSHFAEIKILFAVPS